MPERSFEGLTLADRAIVSTYELGYDWVPDRFGPPPGIPRSKKQELGKISFTTALFL